MNKRPAPAFGRHFALRSWLSYLGRYKLRVGLLMVCFIIGNLMIAVIPVFIGKLIGALSATPVQGHQAIMWVWVLIALSSSHDIMWHACELLHMKFVSPLSYHYETMLFHEVIRKPYPYFIDKFTGKLSSYITTVSQELHEFLDNMFYNYTGMAVNLVTTSIIFAAINWQTAAIFVAGLVGMFIMGRHTIRRSGHFEKLSADVKSTKNGKLVDIIANFASVKSFRTEAAEWRAISREQQKALTAGNRSYFWEVIFWASMSLFVRQLLWPATIGLNVYLFLHHEISLAELTTVLSTILLFSTTIWEMVWALSQFNLKMARVDEAHMYLLGPVNFIRQLDQRASRDRDPATAPPAIRQSLTFDGLHFAYPDQPHVQVLRNINVHIREGEKVGIVGRSGSGKTTLTKLLLDYYPVESGILLDGMPIDTAHLAQLISYVPQDTGLFHRTIADNIAYAADHPVSREEVISAAKRAHADEFISQITDGYDALVGERGVKLSAGQRQRIAIARAYLDDKPILILDEATSALDSESEILVQQALEALWEQKTVIAIAHRLSTLRHMDRIVVMDKGTIIEEGSHQNLLQQNGMYAKLWAHQSGGFIKE